MTHEDLITAVAAKSGETKAATAKIIKAALAEITDTLADGGKIVFKGFGTFSTAVRPARTMRNIQTGEPLDVPQGVIAKFKPGADLKNAVNG